MKKELHIVVVGGSAGSLAVLLDVLPGLHLHEHLVLVIVLHRKNTSDSMLQELLSARSGLNVKEVEDKQQLQGTGVYLAPADYHLLFEADQTLSLDFSEKVNFSRPSIDVAFESAAAVYRERLSCILLSGASADGAEGLRQVMEAGGTVVIQDPATAETPYMPQYALDRLPYARILKPADMAAFINSLH